MMHQRISGLILFLLMFSSTAFGKETRPNILLIMCDDMGFSDLGCYGGEVSTPHLDQLASEGMRFTQFYNNAKCTTTRASLVTGLYPRFGKQGHLRKNMVTIGEVMKQAGYATALCGKWHLGRTKISHPYHRGFDYYYGLLDGACNYFEPTRKDPPFKQNRVRHFGKNDREITEFPEDFYTTDAFTDAAIQFLKKNSNEDKPFFLHVTYTAPHYPLHAKPEDIKKYIGKFRMGWNEMRRQRWERLKKMGIPDQSWSLTEGDSRAYSWENANQEFEDKRMAVYAAMIDSMDQNIGRLLKTLKQTGADDNTLILFFSDNGGCAEEPGGRDPVKRNPGPKEDYVTVGPAWGWAQNSPFKRYKQWVHEGGITTPCIAWWPGKVPAGTINRNTAHLIDILPTCLEIAGSSYPETYKGNQILPCEGLSMANLLKNQDRKGHKQLAWYWSKNRAIRQENWKLVWDKEYTQWELYDLSQDRCESKNLAKKFPDRVQKMSEDWFKWAAKCELKIKN
jgi:arylsulfatase A-like enzyme